jgi:transcriptional regulator with XRE-family HTH domain
MAIIIAHHANKCQALFASHALRKTQSQSKMAIMNKTLGEIVRQLRKSKGLTLSELADSVEGYDAGNLSRFETNKQEIAADKLKLIATALDTTVGHIYNLCEGNATSVAKQDVFQYESQDFKKYTDKLNTDEKQQVHELLGYFVSITPKHKKRIIELTSDFYESDTRIAKLARMRAPPAGLIEGNENDSRRVTAKKA